MVYIDAGTSNAVRYMNSRLVWSRVQKSPIYTWLFNLLKPKKLKLPCWKHDSQGPNRTGSACRSPSRAKLVRFDQEEHSRLRRCVAGRYESAASHRPKPKQQFRGKVVNSRHSDPFAMTDARAWHGNGNPLCHWDHPSRAPGSCPARTHWHNWPQHVIWVWLLDVTGMAQ